MDYAEKYSNGLLMGLKNFKARLARGEDAAAGFVGDSTFRNSAALPYQFAVALAAAYPAYRVELRRAANNMQSTTRTVVAAGPSGERYREFPVGTTKGAYIGPSLQRSSLNGVSGFRLELGIALPSGSLTGGFPTVNCEVTGFGTAGNRTYFYLGSNGYPVIQVQGAGSTYALIFPNIPLQSAMTGNSRIDIAVDFTANSAGASRASFYTSADGGATWSPLGAGNHGSNASGSQVAQVDITHAAGAYYLGAPVSAPTQNGLRVYRCQWYSTTTTPVPILPERIDAWTSSAGQNGLTSVLGGSPTIYIDQAAQDGATIDTNGFFTGAGAGDFATEAYRCFLDHMQDFVQINSSHNDAGIDTPNWEAYMDLAATAVTNWLLRDPVILHTTQNPQQTNDANELSAQHNRRQADIMLYASKKGRGCTDIYRAWVEANNSANDEGAGDVHPSATGYIFWGQVFSRIFRAA